MTRKKNTAERQSWKELMSEDADFLKPLLREIVQQVLEAEMEEVSGPDTPVNQYEHTEWPIREAF
jgi:hypothetical protein